MNAFSFDPATTVNVNVTNNTLQNSVAAHLSFQASGGNLNYTIDNNNFQNSSGGSSINIKSDSSGSIGTTSRSISGNTIGTAGGNFSGGCNACSSISINTDNSSRGNANIVGNTINGIGTYAIQTTPRLTSRRNVVMTGNLINASAGVNHSAAVIAESGAASGQSACLTLTMGGTVVPGAYPSTVANAKNRITGNFDPTSMGGSGIEVYLQQYSGSTFNLPGLVGSTAGQAEAHVAARNEITSADGLNVFPSGTFAGAASCP